MLSTSFFATPAVLLHLLPRSFGNKEVNKMDAAYEIKGRAGLQSRGALL